MNYRTRDSWRRAVLALLCVGGLWAIQGCRSEVGASGPITLSGTVEARETVLGFQVAGRIARLLHDEGEQVTAGEPVALLATEDYALAVDRAKAEVAAAEAALAELEAGTRSQELRVAEAALDKAKAELRYGEAEVGRTGRLLKQKLAPQDQLDQARLRRDVARAAVRQARQNLALLQEGPRRETIDGARAQLAARRAALESARRRLGYARLESPVDGVVTLRQAEAGEVVGAGQPVLRVAELKRPWVRTYLNETDLARVRVGQAATVTVDGLPDRRFSGRLSFIAPNAEFTPKSVETRALRVDQVYRVKVEVEDPEGLLKIGMPADVTLEAAPRP